MKISKIFPFLPTIALNVCMFPAFGEGQRRERPAGSNTSPSLKQSLKRFNNKDSNTMRINTNEMMLDVVERATFQWFVDNQNPTTGLILDRSARDHIPSTIAGTGFGLTVYAIASKRGWITREEAAAYTLKVTRVLYNAPQGPQATGVSGFHGYFYHFLDPATGVRAMAPDFWNSELSSIDTALLMAGVVFARNFYGADNAVESEIRTLCDALYDRVEWTWLLKPDNTIGHGFSPETGMIPYSYKGYSEAVLLYVLALGSKDHAVPAESWKAFIGDAKIARPDRYGKKMIMLPGMPLFTYQYPMAWIDFRGIQDDVSRSLGCDYFENSRRATYAQWRYAKRNEAGMVGYGPKVWGLTASDGPGNETKTVNGKEVTFRAYSERGAPGGFDDGTIAPTAAISSLPYAPKIVLPTIRNWLTSRPELFDKHGFTDAFNPTFDTTKPSGWVDSDKLSIDQGPIVVMIENYRSGLVWEVMRNDSRLRDGLRRAGFTGGWLK